jgi:hypothetical protein
MLHESIKVTLIAVSVKQLIYLFLTRYCLFPILPITLERHPCPLGKQKYFNKEGFG